MPHFSNKIRFHSPNIRKCGLSQRCKLLYYPRFQSFQCAWSLETKGPYFKWRLTTKTYFFKEHVSICTQKNVMLMIKSHKCGATHEQVAFVRLK